MLDSSPPAPPTRRPLKRSASTASLASLPTPPRTHRRHARGRSRGSCDSDSDDHAILSTDDDEAHGAHKNKKRRTSQVVSDDRDEEAFWLGGPASSSTTAVASTAGSSKATAATTAATTSTSKSHPQHTAPLLYRRMLDQAKLAVEVAPVSPPPSHRCAAIPLPSNASLKPASLDSTTSSPPRTPRTRAATKRDALLQLALRDSPENPFLVTPPSKAVVEDSASPSPSVDSANPSPHTPVNHEKPTLTYVFRGVRRTYQNPLYNHAEDKPFSPSPASLLPIDHPEYSPPVHCTPKLLFPAARHHKHGHHLRGKKLVAEKRPRSVDGLSDVDDDEGLDGADVRPKKLDFGKEVKQVKGKESKAKIVKGKTVKTTRTKAQKQTLDKELGIVGEDVFL